MRRSDKEIISRKEIDNIINSCEVCRLALVSNNEPYLVPVSYGYDGEKIYFHTSKSGKKINFFSKNNKVCFEFEKNVRLIKHPSDPCKWTFHFESVIGYGVISELVSDEEKKNGLNIIMKHYSGRDWKNEMGTVKNTRVWIIKIESMTAKRSAQKDE